MTFVDYVTPVPADWLNNVNAVVNSVTPTTPSITVSSIANLRLVNHLLNQNAQVTGYTTPGDGGGGFYYYNAADITSTDNGGTIIVAADGARWYLNFAGTISVLQFGANDENTADNATVFANIATWWLAQANPPALVFSEGTYQYSVSPNWALSNSQILFLGRVNLNYTGTGNAFILDAGSGSQYIYNQQILGNPQIYGGASSQNAIFVRSWHHSYLSAQVRGAGTGAQMAGLAVQFAVCSNFDVDIGWGSNGGWLGGQPNLGMFLTRRTGSETISYCNFRCPIVEHCVSGIELDYALGCQFYGGTSEAHTNYGVVTTVNSLNNTFYSTDFEVNGTGDIFDAGTNNRWIGVDGQDTIEFAPTCVGARFVDSMVNSITIDAGATNVALSGVTYNRLNTGTLVDNGTHTRYRDIRNAGTNVTSNVPLTLSSIAPGTSPFTYTNTSGNEVSVLVTGGTVSGISFVRSGIPLATNSTTGLFTLSPTDALVVTYTGVPGMELYTR